MKRKTFPHPFSDRAQDPGWAVIQSHTLLCLAAKKERNASFALYAALEMRNAIEAEMFVIVSLANEGPISKELLARCRKKDGLFQALAEAEPNYTKLCLFAEAWRKHYPKIPSIAEWDVRTLRRLWSGLAEYCHVPLVASETKSGAWFEKVSKTVLEAYDYMAGKMASGGTGFLNIQSSKAPVQKLWEDFRDSRITIQDVRERIPLIRDVLPHLPK